MQILLNNKGTTFEEVEADVNGSDIDQPIQLSKSVNGFAIPYPMAQVLRSWFLETSSNQENPALIRFNSWVAKFFV